MRDSCGLLVTEIVKFLNEWTNALNFSLFPIILLAGSDLQSRSEFLHHGSIVARIVTSNVANLCREG